MQCSVKLIQAVGFTLLGNRIDSDMRVISQKSAATSS
jgi:hypothetical protein